MSPSCGNYSDNCDCLKRDTMKIYGHSLGKIIDSDGRVYSGPEIHEKARYRASILMRKGIKPGDRIVICHGGTGEFFTDLGEFF